MRVDEGNGYPSYIGNVFLTPEKEVLFLQSLKLIYDKLCPPLGPLVPTLR